GAGAATDRGLACLREASSGMRSIAASSIHVVRGTKDICIVFLSRARREIRSITTRSGFAARVAIHAGMMYRRRLLLRMRSRLAETTHSTVAVARDIGSSCLRGARERMSRTAILANAALSTFAVGAATGSRRLASSLYRLRTRRFHERRDRLSLKLRTAAFRGRLAPDHDARGLLVLFIFGAVVGGFDIIMLVQSRPAAVLASSHPAAPSSTTVVQAMPTAL